MTVDIHVIGGFLGAGKTTTLRHLLAQVGPAERAAVIVNDFGEAGIDEALLGVDRHTLRAIPGACICCTAPEGFVAAVRDLLGSATRILVEPTGLARASDLVDSLRRAPFADKLAIGPVTVIVDPAMLASHRLPHEALDQIAVADVLVINRTDLCSPDELSAARTVIASLWPGPARIIETVHGQVPFDMLMWPEGVGPKMKTASHSHDPLHEHDHDHSHDHDHVDSYMSRSRIWPPETIFRWGKLTSALETSSCAIARGKGLFRTDEGLFRLDLAGGRVSSAPSGWRRDSRLDLIGTDEAALDSLLSSIEAATCPPQQLHAALGAIEIAWPGGGRLFERSALSALPDGVDDVSTLVSGRQGVAARLREILSALSLPVDRSAVIVARDGYTTPPVPLSELSDALLVHSLGDAPLPDAQGGPFRLLIPGSASPCANVKGVVRIAVR